MPRFPRLVATAVVALAYALPAVAGAQPPTLPPPAVEPPVPLRTPPLWVPEETAGTGLEPEATVRLSIDARGRVTKVEMLSITPSTEFDELFRERLEETFLEWRYAPLRRDGLAEATTLEWRVRFPARSADASAGEGSSSSVAAQAAGFAIRNDAEARRSRILALPEAQRLALLEEQVRTARSVLDPKSARTHSSERFVVATDSTDERAAESLANLMESVFSILSRELLPGIELQPERYKLHLVAYRSREEYQRLLERMPHYEWSAGFYSPAGMIACHLEQPSFDDLVGLLLHEATHAFLDRHLVRRGIALPRWLGEGFAEYVGNSAIQKGRLVPGKTIRRKYEIWQGTVAKVQTSGSVQIDEAKKELRAGRGLGVRELLDASTETFYGDGYRNFYGSSWLLVHFLRHGEDGWAEERFPRALLYAAEGFPTAAAFEQSYGSLDALDAGFREYVRRF